MTEGVRLRTALTDLTGVEHPVVQTAMGWVSDADLVVATAEAGGLGFIASAMMGFDELESTIRAVKDRTDKPFGVNLRADASDAAERADLLITHGVKVAGFALAPKRELIERLKDNGVVVIPSVGAPRHAQKVAEWGADMVMIQGREGGGHTGSIPTSLLLPAVIDAVDIPVISAGGYFDGRGLASALACGAAGVGMGTRFLLTRDCNVPDHIKQLYLDQDLNGTAVTRKFDGMPLRVLRVGLAAEVEKQGDAAKSAGFSLRKVRQLKEASGASWIRLMRDGLGGDVEHGLVAAGQVTGVIDDIPSVAELIERVVAGAVDAIERVRGAVVN